MSIQICINIVLRHTSQTMFGRFPLRSQRVGIAEVDFKVYNRMLYNQTFI